MQQRSLTNSAIYGELKCLSSDNGSKYTNSDFKALLTKNRDRHETSAPYTPHKKKKLRVRGEDFVEWAGTICYWIANSQTDFEMMRYKQQLTSEIGVSVIAQRKHNAKF